MTVGVVGAGLMGTGIAQAFAAGGYDVILCDLTEALAQKGMLRITKKLQARAERKKLDGDTMRTLLSHLQCGPLSAMATCQIVVEAVVENRQIKKDIFSTLDEICGEDTLFTSNTSSMSLTELAHGLGRNVVGMHFFNPAETMALVEVTAGSNTAPALVEKICALARSIGKTPVEVQEAPGFVVNRLLIPMINEAVCLLAEGVASAEDIDTAMRLGANHPMGPLALGDLVGLDTCLAIMETLQAETGDDKYRPHPLLRKMVRAGHLGRKSGQGFFCYS